MHLRSAFAILPFCFSAVTASAGLPTAWVEAPAYAPNLKVWIHEDSAREESPSTVTIQKHSLQETKVAKLLNKARGEGWKSTDLLPAECYLVKDAKLVSRQTWCVGKGDNMFAFIELGSHQISENQMQSLIFSTLKENP